MQCIWEKTRLLVSLRYPPHRSNIYIYSEVYIYRVLSTVLELFTRCLALSRRFFQLLHKPLPIPELKR